MTHARGNNAFIAFSLALVLACGAAAFGAREEPTVDKPADGKKDEPAKEPVPIRALTSEQRVEARRRLVCRDAGRAHSRACCGRSVALAS